MKIIDKYISRQFISTTIFGIIAFTVLFVAINVMEELDDFIDKQIPNKVIVEYYISYIPEIIKLITPIAVLLSSLFVTGKLSNTNEITALKSSGISMLRFLVPILIISFFISIISVYFNGWVVPEANKKKFKIRREYFETNYKEHARNDIVIQDGTKKIISIKYFDKIQNTGTNTSIYEFSDSSRISPITRIDAGSILFDTSTNNWIVKNGISRIFTNSGEVISNFKELNVGTLNITPTEIIKIEEKPDEMGFNDLNNFINRQEQSGHNVARWKVEFHSKISFPFASFIVVLFGVPFSYGKRRAGLAIQFGISLLICFIYLAFIKVSQVFGYSGELNSVFTAWMANIIFLIGGLINLIRVSK